MKTRTTIAALLLLVAGSVVAGPAGTPPGAGARHIDRLAILLDLDEGQKESVRQVLDAQFQQRADLWKKAEDSQTRPTREEMRSQHDQMRAETIEKLRPILSDQQMTKFEVLAEMGPGRHHDKRHDRPE